MVIPLYRRAHKLYMVFSKGNTIVFFNPPGKILQHTSETIWLGLGGPHARTFRQVEVIGPVQKQWQ